MALVPYTAEKAYDLIESAHGRGRLAHAFLITGPAGSGKESLAAKIISLVNPEDDSGGANLFGEIEQPKEKSLTEQEGELVRVVRPESKSRRIKIESIRDLEHSFHMASIPGKWKIGVIVDADRMGEGAENAFLKTLEEPPSDCLLLLLSAAPELLLPTILSRCVRMEIMPTEGRRGELLPAAQQLLEKLSQHTRSGLGGVATGLTLRGCFSDLLADYKTEFTKANEAIYKDEAAKYSKTTDSDEWLAQREAYYIAKAQAEYLDLRGKLLDVLVSWMGDVMRWKCGVRELDFPSESKVTERMAQNQELPSLLQRVESLEGLRRHLETNVQEQLALEVAFLKAFG